MLTQEEAEELREAVRIAYEDQEGLKIKLLRIINREVEIPKQEAVRNDK